MEIYWKLELKVKFAPIWLLVIKLKFTQNLQKLGSELLSDLKCLPANNAFNIQ